MVLILSEEQEKTTNNVTEWFIALLVDFFKITRKSKIDIYALIGNDDIKFIINEIKIDEISAFWVRKGIFMAFSSKLMNIELNISEYLTFESKVLLDFSVNELQKKRYLGNYFDSVPNKINHLLIAKESGLAVPETIIVSKYSNLVAFRNKHDYLINKAIKDSYMGVHDSVYYYNHTERVTPEALADMPDTFFPTLVQEELQKAYELRVVFVCRKLYAMAIFSQNDVQTSVDWRNYNNQRPNRTVPYTLPSLVEAAIQRFIDKSGLNTGAIDMVVTTDKRYVFLECNPNGQISMVSENCNYPIEKDIALYLAYGTDPGTGA